MKNINKYLVSALAICVSAGVSNHSWAAVSAGEAAALKTTLTPLGAEKAGSADGTIPAWTGGMTSDPGFDGNRRDHLFKNEKPLFTITAANMAQYADKLSDGTKAMLTKYPDTYRLNIYKTVRSMAAPQWVYDNTFQNATSAEMTESSAGRIPAHAFGGIPFPIPKDGEEAMWNYITNWRGKSALQEKFNAYLITSDSQRVLTSTGMLELQWPYYMEQNRNSFDGNYQSYRLVFTGPPIRAGEGLTGRENLNQDKAQTYVYLTGQRRVRMLPNACCDTPAPSSAGVMSFDELFLFYGPTKRFDWTIVGKKEMYVPYNDNAGLSAKYQDYISDHHLNPDDQRYELHRVWVVDAKLKPGNRHVAKHSRYYIDEDSWNTLLAERWDANDTLWKVLYLIPVTAPDMPAVLPLAFGFYDLISGTWFVNSLPNEANSMWKIVPEYSADNFTGDALAGDGVR